MFLYCGYKYNSVDRISRKQNALYECRYQNDHHSLLLNLMKYTAKGINASNMLVKLKQFRYSHITRK